MGTQKSEACGRCSMTTVVDAVGDEERRAERDPFAGDRIEVDENEMRRITPGAWLGGITERLNRAATKLTYGDDR